MLTLKLDELNASDAQHYLQHAIAPRPICFASTIDSNGIVNLSPFSFFNLFSTTPPIVIFSPVRRVRNNTPKHTLENLQEVPEVAINIVTYEMVQQVSLASCEFPKGMDEFVKAGFTKEASILIKPPRVAESPVQLECKVLEIKPLGTGGGAGNLVIAEVVMMHINETILNESGKIDQQKLDLVARLGGNWYTRANASTIFEVEKPNTKISIGMDALPGAIRTSNILSGNNLAQLASVDEAPVVDPSFDDDTLKNIILYYSISPAEMETELHLYAKQLLDKGKTAEAWQILLAGNSFSSF
jgi:flavin reductase (DIM6/NTAB) family NADH-FMN oxidoreductase RutF